MILDSKTNCKHGPSSAAIILANTRQKRIELILSNIPNLILDVGGHVLYSPIQYSVIISIASER